MRCRRVGREISGNSDGLGFRLTARVRAGHITRDVKATGALAAGRQAARLPRRTGGREWEPLRRACPGDCYVTCYGRNGRDSLDRAACIRDHGWKVMRRRMRGPLAPIVRDLPPVIRSKGRRSHDQGRSAAHLGRGRSDGEGSKLDGCGPRRCVRFRALEAAIRCCAGQSGPRKQQAAVVRLFECEGSLTPGAGGCCHTRSRWERILSRLESAGGVSRRARIGESRE